MFALNVLRLWGKWNWFNKGKYACLLFAFFICGCGSSEEIFSESENVKFSFDNHNFEYFLPENWQKNENSQFIGASLGSENFVITRHHLPEGEIADVTRYFLDEASKTFFYFEEVSFDDDQWVFRAKKSATSPEREFHQKIVVVPDNNTFLMGSCSLELSVDSNVDCVNVINKFRLILAN